MLSNKEQLRYQRQLILPKFGAKAQEKLKNSTVFVVGAGGLGGPVCYYLAAAGVGNLIICDRDTVELTNLNRQILHGTQDLDVPKVESAYQTLANLNPEIIIKIHHTTVQENNIEELAKDADIIVDCLDNVETRIEINKYIIKANKPIMHAGIDEWTSQLTLIHPPETACMYCLFGSYTDTKEPKPVLGALAGVTGTYQAMETIKHLAGIGKSLKNKLAYYDAINGDWNIIPIHKDETCPVCGDLQ